MLYSLFTSWKSWIGGHRENVNVYRATFAYHVHERDSWQDKIHFDKLVNTVHLTSTNVSIMEILVACKASACVSQTDKTS